MLKNIGVCAGLCGAAIACMAPGSGYSEMEIYALICALLSSVIIGVNTFLVRRYMKDHSSLEIVCVLNLAGAVVLAPFFITAFFQPLNQVMLGVSYGALVGFCSFVLFFSSIKR